MPADPTGLDGERFRYDIADNLTEQSKKAFGIDQVTTLPVDPSGRNRPASIHGIPLTWDPNGNLTDKGDLHFEYDYRNLLSRVTRGGQEARSSLCSKARRGSKRAASIGAYSSKRWRNVPRRTWPESRG